MLETFGEKIGGGRSEGGQFTSSSSAPPWRYSSSALTALSVVPESSLDLFDTGSKRFAEIGIDIGIGRTSTLSDFVEI